MPAPLGLMDRIIGTLSSSFQWDGVAGPLVKNVAGKLSTRDSVDGADAEVLGADPTEAQAFVTRAYGDANYAGEATAVKTIRKPLALITIASSSTIPGSARVLESRMEIATPYDGAATWTVAKTVGGVPVIQALDATETTFANAYVERQDTDWTATASTVTWTVGGAPTVGAAAGLVKYAEPGT